MPTAVLTDRERTAVQAYLRLLHTVRATLDAEPADPSRAGSAPMVPPTVLAEADEALSQAGLAGHEEEFDRLLASWGPRA